MIDGRKLAWSINRALKTMRRYKMRTLKVGDKVTIEDASWAFGVQDGQYKMAPHQLDDGKIEFTIIATGLRAIGDVSRMGGYYPNECDLLVTDNTGSF
ncbi:unnamed protein product [marine sediment metagenome]|uniref:Uncharacterized protein n=1 Tax=marine sediment metagenome TaxID=412755 RepID=X1EZG3_9ZZZZ